MYFLWEPALTESRLCSSCPVYAHITHIFSKTTTTTTTINHKASRVCSVKIPSVNPVCWLLHSCLSGTHTSSTPDFFLGQIWQLKVSVLSFNKCVLQLSLNADCCTSAPSGIMSDYLGVSAGVLHFLAAYTLGYAVVYRC